MLLGIVYFAMDWETQILSKRSDCWFAPTFYWILSEKDFRNQERISFSSFVKNFNFSWMKLLGIQLRLMGLNPRNGAAFMSDFVVWDCHNKFLKKHSCEILLIFSMWKICDGFMKILRQIPNQRFGRKDQAVENMNLTFSSKNSLWWVKTLKETHQSTAMNSLGDCEWSCILLKIHRRPGTFHWNKFLGPIIEITCHKDYLS